MYQSTTFKYDNSGRNGNAIRLKERRLFLQQTAKSNKMTHVAKKIAALKGGVGAVLTSSGQAANFMHCLIYEAGDHVIVMRYMAELSTCLV